MDGNDLVTTGSIGAGIVIDEGVTVIAHASSMPTVRTVHRNGMRDLMNRMIARLNCA
ncbi:MAG: hypothetical protein WC015_03670 [Methanoregula sp.]